MKDNEEFIAFATIALLAADIIHRGLPANEKFMTNMVDMALHMANEVARGVGK